MSNSFEYNFYKKIKKAQFTMYDFFIAFKKFVAYTDAA